VRRQLLCDGSLSPTTQPGSEELSYTVYYLDGVPGPATKDIVNVVGLVRWQLQHPAWLQYGVDEDTGYGCARNEASYRKTPLRRSKKEPPPPL
jgi:hypothetical protein